MYVYCVQALSSEVMPKHESLQELNYAAEELIKSSTADQAALIRDPLADINRRWETLHHDIAKKTVRFCETDIFRVYSSLMFVICVLP